MSRNYLNSQAFRDHDASWDGERWTVPANTHPDTGPLPSTREPRSGSDRARDAHKPSDLSEDGKVHTS